MGKPVRPKNGWRYCHFNSSITFMMYMVIMKKLTAEARSRWLL
ncbi:hypothetical protein [Peribacillus sp. NPDC055009]